MRFFLFFNPLIILMYYNNLVYGWKILQWISNTAQKENEIVKENDEFTEYQRKISDTGRVFVTMLGYPSRCERKGISHACTLSVACWWVGGSSQAGCGANPWLVACCVKSKAKQELHSNYEFGYEDTHQNLDEETIPSIQKRNDDFEDDEEEECGISSDRVMLKRVIGGNQATFAQFPWQAHLKISTYQCGGVLVNRRFVATAAHCIIRARIKDINVYLGELDTQDTGKVIELAPSEKHKVRKKIIHPKFKFRTTQPDRYDLALLELSSKAGQSYHILPICLPENGIKLQGRNAVVAGWGKTKPSTDLTGTNVLQSATVPILDIKECMSWHRTKEITVELHEEMLCAGHKDGHKDACLGDSGGPLIILENGRWTLAGIISAGFGCGEPNQPGIYHSVAVTADWIRSNINS